MPKYTGCSLYAQGLTILLRRYIFQIKWYRHWQYQVTKTVQGTYKIDANVLGVQRVLVLGGVMWKSRATTGPKVCGMAKVVFGQVHFLMPTMLIPLCVGSHRTFS